MRYLLKHSVIVLTMCLACCSKNEDADIVGTWQRESCDGSESNISYEFHVNGTVQTFGFSSAVQVFDCGFVPNGYHEYKWSNETIEFKRILPSNATALSPIDEHI